MKIKVQGELTLLQLSQAVFEQLMEVEDRFQVRHARDITLYFTPTNGFSHEVVCRDAQGKEVPVIFCHGPYRSAADDYDI